MTSERAARAGLWSTIDVTLRQGVQFFTSIILARLLLPADFGLIALLTFFSSFSIVFVHGGLSEALIQRQTSTLEEESSVFWWNVAASVLFSIVLIALGPLIASFYNAPALRGLMALAAFQTVCASLSAVQIALITRDLRFDRITKAGFMSSAVSGAAAVTAAWWGAGIWALAIQMATSALVFTVVLWMVSDWRPVKHFRLGTIRHLLGFGFWLSLSSGLEILYTQGFSLLLGKLHGLSQLGLYNRAVGTQQLPAGVFSAVISRIAFPLLSLRKDDPDAMRAGLRQANSLAMLVNVPIMVGLALLPDLVIEVLFGAKWLPAAPILAILAWSGIIFPLHVLNLQTILSQGRTRTYFRVEIIKKIIGIGAVVIGSLFGILGLALAQLVSSIIAMFINIEPVRRSLGYNAWAQLRDMSGIIWAATVMMGIVMLLRSTITLPALPQLVLLTVAGALSYALTGLLAGDRSFKEALDVGRTLMRRPSRT